MVLQTDPRISQSSYQHALDIGETGTEKLTTETVRYWSDFNRVFYHPRSIVQINDYELGSTLLPFEKWESGEELYLTLDRDSDLLDRDVRPWAEECDQMQGVQVFASADDAWGGFTARYVEAIRDEFGKLPVWCWGVEEAEGRGPKAKQMVRTWNAARTTNEMGAYFHHYLPAHGFSLPGTANTKVSTSIASFSIYSGVGPNQESTAIFAIRFRLAMANFGLVVRGSGEHDVALEAEAQKW